MEMKLDNQTWEITPPANIWIDENLVNRLRWDGSRLKGYILIEDGEDVYTSDRMAISHTIDKTERFDADEFKLTLVQNDDTDEPYISVHVDNLEVTVHQNFSHKLTLRT